MGVLCDRQLIELAKGGMIEPFAPSQISTSQDGSRTISHGVSSYGYDARLAPEFQVFTNVHSVVIDVKNFDPKTFVELEGDTCLIPPNSFLSARTVEYFRIPRDVLVICLGKSSYARCGLPVTVTPLEPEWEGHVTLEIHNGTPLPARIYANEGICQFVFLRGDQVCDVSYADRKGKYQGQRGITPPRL